MDIYCSNGKHQVSKDRMYKDLGKEKSPFGYRTLCICIDCFIKKAKKGDTAPADTELASLFTDYMIDMIARPKGVDESYNALIEKLGLKDKVKTTGDGET